MNKSPLNEKQHSWKIKEKRNSRQKSKSSALSMTLQEALDTDVGATVDYLKTHMSVKDGERLDELIGTLKKHLRFAVEVNAYYPKICEDE